jgi:hypothetical protein
MPTSRHFKKRKSLKTLKRFSHSGTRGIGRTGVRGEVRSVGQWLNFNYCRLLFTLAL